jgi:hypothetical protein
MSNVAVLCPAGSNPARVQPAIDSISRGDSIRWHMTGPVLSDSVNITLKNAQQRWPFAGTAPHGDSVATTAQAVDSGAYQYRVALWCRVPGGTAQPDTIDPDIIIM